LLTLNMLNILVCTALRLDLSEHIWRFDVFKYNIYSNPYVIPAYYQIDQTMYPVNGHRLAERVRA
jgi:hypothetical protein